MSEPIFRALMQLFALVSDIGNIDEISTREKDVVRSFLARHLNNELVEKYLKIFDGYLDLYINKEAIKAGSGEQEVSSLKTMRIKKICESINKELRHKQKIYIIIQLIDFISYGKDITENELDFLMTVALALNIQENEYKNIKSFILDPVSRVHEKEKLLLINNSLVCKFRKVKHIYVPNLSGDLSLLNITSTKSFILRYTGERNLSLNGQHIYPRQSYMFDLGSTIKGEGLKTVYYSEVFDFFNEVKSESKISLSANNVSYHFADTEMGIRDFNLREESGQLIGILGVSGTGKSTLLNLLNGSISPHSGAIYVNGYNINNIKDRNELKGIIGYVPQDDLLIEDLTVYQNLFYNAKLCLNNFPVKKIKKTVGKIMVDLDLWEIRDLKVGSPLEKVISGGQRKRINIALELVREPLILFVDEPTSGLSSIDSEVVINLLKEQTYKGKLVLVNIHQPGSDLFKLFDKIIILDKGGFQIYYGNPNAAIVYFKSISQQANPDEDQCIKCGNINPELILQIVEAKIVNEHGKLTGTRKVTPEEWGNLFRNNFTELIKFSPEQKKKLPYNYYSIPGKIKQMVIFFTRDFLSKLANKQYLLIGFLGAPLLALLLGYFTRYVKRETYQFMENENLPAYIFMCVITSMFLGLIISSQEVLKDRKILKRESFLNLSWFSYINSKMIMMFLISAIQAISFILVGNTILGIKGMTFSYWLVLFSTSCCANMIGLNISSALNSVITIYILIPFILIPQLLFSGVMVKYERLHRSGHYSYEYVPIIGELMPARWAFEALAVEQFRNNKYEKRLFSYEMDRSRNNWFSPYMVNILDEDLQKIQHPVTDIVSRKKNIREFGSNLKQISDEAGFKVPDLIKTSIEKEEFDSLSVKKTQTYLKILSKEFNHRKNVANHLMDSVSSLPVDGKSDIADKVNLKTRYYNERLATWVLNEELPEKYIRTPDKIIQKLEPVFMAPTSSYGRAHFYAPYKKIGATEIDTYVFNLLVIWTVSLVLYIALYFNLMRKIVGGIEALRSKGINSTFPDLEISFIV